MPCFDIGERLFRLLGLHDDLEMRQKREIEINSTPSARPCGDGRRNYPLREHGGIALLQHLLQLFVCRRSTRCKGNRKIMLESRENRRRRRRLTNFQLSLYSSFASFSVVSLSPVVLGHHLDEFARQRRVLCLPYPQIGVGLIRLLFLLNVLFDTLDGGREEVGN